FIPEMMGAVFANLGSVTTKIGGIECICAASDAPLRIFDDVFFQFGQAEDRVVIVNGRERVFTAERKNVPVVAADAFTGKDGFFAVRADANAAAAFVAGPGGVNALASAGVEFAHHETHCSSHAADL